MQYVKTGKCIWCGRTIPDVSFHTIPHIIPGSLGGNETGFDVCDECNHYFGTSQQRRPSPDVVFKEIFNVTRLTREDLDENTHKKFKSIFFQYRHSHNAFIIKSSFNERIITTQFKRGLYEVFLQMYHKKTGDGNNPKFAAVRDFARFNKGELKVFYAFNNIVLSPDFNADPELVISDNLIEDMNRTGVFLFWFFSHPLYLEVFPTLFNVYGRKYLQNEANSMLLNVKGNECIFELQNIMQMDFFMQRFNSQ